MSDDKLKPAASHAELTDKIEQLAKVGKGGVGEALDNIYEQTTVVPMDTVLAVRAQDKAFIAASADAWGNLSRAAAVEDRNVTSTSARFPMGGGSYVDFTWDREVERNAGIAQKGEVAPKKTVYGAMSGKAVMGGSDSGAGELNKVFKRQKQAAYDLFAPATATA